VKQASSSLPITAYLLPSKRSSSAPITITIPDSDQGENAESNPPPPPRKMTAAMRLQRGRATATAAAAAAVHRTSSLPINTNDADSDDDDDKLPLSVILSRYTQQVSQPSAVVRRAMSDISNVVDTPPAVKWQLQYDRKRSFYQRMRAQLAHPDDNSMCAYCGKREHSALHHEDDVKRAGTGVSSSHMHLMHSSLRDIHPHLLHPHAVYCDAVQIRIPSALTPAQLEAEVKRCTRDDGTIGLVALCLTCHREADAKKGKYRCPKRQQRYIARNRRLDKAAKIARGECECDEKCHRPVTEEDVQMLEWDHLVQSFNDPGYRCVGLLVSSGASTAACDKERSKCRLLHARCHRRHSAEQTQQAARRRASKRSA